MKMNLLAGHARWGLVAMTLAVALAGCDKAGDKSAGPMLDLPSTPDGVATLPDPNHSGPHQIDLVVSTPNKFFCVDPTKPPNVFVIRGADNKKYLVIESNKECPGDPDHSGPHQAPTQAN